MRLSMGMEARQLQVQKLAPRMIQSMEILQLPTIALQERIEQEMNDNPLLEIEELDPNLPDEDARELSTGPMTEDERELVVKDDASQADDFERLANMDSTMPDSFDDFRPSANRVQDASDRQHDVMANAVARPESLNDFLLHQLAELDIDSDLEALAERINSSLDARDGGYLRAPLADLLPSDHTPDDLARAEEALLIVQSLDPPGIASRTLSECLLRQLRPDMPNYDPLRVIIESHLEDLADNRLPQIQKRTGFTLEMIQQVRQQLHQLNPKPGAAFMEVIVPTVTPDVVLDTDEEGAYRVRLIDDWLPPLRISHYYRQRLEDPKATAEEREFIKRKIMGAQWLIDAIEQRRSTLLKVSQAIIDYQTRFLEEGPEALEPLKMQQIADQVGVHVTTISRAVDDKWIQTPRGLFPLRRFFVGGTRSEDGEDVAWDAIRVKLTEIIEKEDKSNPLCDEDLVDQLAKQGLTVARRTITKYRKKMGIPSSRQRRDWTKVGKPL
jgi:RNA polymerase sigma-54 factor